MVRPSGLGIGTNSSPSRVTCSKPEPSGAIRKTQTPAFTKVWKYTHRPSAVALGAIAGAASVVNWRGPEPSALTIHNCGKADAAAEYTTLPSGSNESPDAPSARALG